MEQDSAKGCDCAGVQGTRKMSLLGREGFSCTCEQQPKKCNATETTENPCFSEHLDIVIVDVIHYPSVIAGIVAWENGDNRSKSNALHGMIQENMLRTSKHRSSTRKRNITDSCFRKPLDRFSRTQPGD